MRAIGFDMHMLDQGRRGPSGAKGGKFRLQRSERAMHAPFKIGNIEFVVGHR